MSCSLRKAWMHGRCFLRMALDPAALRDKLQEERA